MNILNSEMPFDEIIIINQLHNGEEKAYQYLYDTYYATLCTYANSLVHDAFWAEAIVGDVFFNMWLKHDSLYIKSSLKGYLMQSVRNRCIDILRSEQSRKHFLKIALTHETEETIADDLSHSHPISKMMAEDLSTQINDIISSLSPECQEVFILSRFEEKTYPEIAQHLGISINTVKYHMKQALKRLRQLDT
ncbi:RNA polymerase sigma-70 factor [Hoylesella nanceiensis]|uniref:RNA polymerase sigma-70 factor n=1 Tax=Hoylesella nanceiensis TaxID=425941 RepID=UPI001CAD9ACE|nr:RNA polymerase sigma-70 factor [Hoylesella nanceiensis]MBF1428650.1 RNA polymerase sigma-70 factor [Hoylesella nanceiensis]